MAGRELVRGGEDQDRDTGEGGRGACIAEILQSFIQRVGLRGYCFVFGLKEKPNSVC